MVGLVLLLLIIIALEAVILFSLKKCNLSMKKQLSSFNCFVCLLIQDLSSSEKAINDNLDKISKQVDSCQMVNDIVYVNTYPEKCPYHDIVYSHYIQFKDSINKDIKEIKNSRAKLSKDIVDFSKNNMNNRSISASKIRSY